MTRAVIATELGDIEVDLFTESAPKAAANFVKLAKDGFFDDVIFHRVIPGFVIQGGDGQFGRSPDVIPDLVGSGGPPYAIKDDPLINAFTRGTVAMANSGPGTTKSQFFVVTKDFGASTTQRPYPIVGHVVSGMDVVDLIASQPRGSGPGFLLDTPVVMTAVTVSNP